MLLPNIRWLHLSDFHVGMDDYAQRKMFDYIFTHVRRRKEDGFVPDFIFVTGDVADKGNGSEYETFWLEFIDPLQEIIDGGITDRTFVVPGNHDVDRKLSPYFDRIEMAGAKSHCFDPSTDGKELRQMLIPRFKAFTENDFTAVKGAFNGDAGAFATTIEIHGSKVGIAGINTAWLSKDDQDERKLALGKGLLEHALEKLRNVDLQIVLGHHPLDWLIPSEQKPVKSLLAQHGVLYLHGHLHNAWAEPTYGGGHQFLAVQSGAAFQAREGEKWRNGLIWGEVDLTKQELKLQPRHWSSDHQDWTLASDAFPENKREGDWWIYPLPATEVAKGLAESSAVKWTQPPKGWATVKPDELEHHIVTLDEDAAIHFFDGAAPSWHTALSTSIPARQILHRLTGAFHHIETSERSIVTLLLAAGCEGKSTAILQAAYELVKGKADWRILRRVDDGEPLNPVQILPVLSDQFRWLVVIDEADRVAAAIHSFVRQLPHKLQGRVHFLIACRDSDWLASKANELTWSSICTFQQERLEGLDSKDAEAIVDAWAAYGTKGLGDLARIPSDRRAARLEQQAHEEAKTSSGAFFGALLAVRHGSDLRNHARLMLERLNQIKIPSGGTLRDALGFIAAMHAEGLEFLSRPVLAWALSCPSTKLQKQVLAPLGQEAAATTSSSFIFTRHRRIAEAVVEVLEKDFAQDLAEIFVELGKAAINSYKSGEIVPDLASWRYRLAEYFFETDRKPLAMNIALQVLNCEPDNVKTLTNAAKLLRRADMPEKALALFRQFKYLTKDRQFFAEWAVSEGETQNHASGVVLAAFSLSDDSAEVRVTNDQAKTDFANLSFQFRELFAKYREVSFRDARIATAILGQQLKLDERAAANFQKGLEEGIAEGATVPTIAEAFVWFIKGIAAAEAIGVHESVLQLVTNPAHLTFNGLERLIHSSMEANQRRR